MNVGIVVQHNYPAEREVRTRRFAKFLNENGNQVAVFARNTTEDPARGTVQSDLRPQNEDMGYASVSRFSWFGNTRVGRVVRAALPFNLFWIVWLILKFRSEDLDAVIACGLRTGLPCVVAGKLLGIPIIVDIRENYPAFVETVDSDGILGLFVYNRRLVDFLERTTVHLADGAIVVADTREEQLASKGINPEKIVRVMNVPLLAEKGPQELLHRGSPDFGTNPIKLVYLGVVRKPRGIQAIIRALNKFDANTYSVELKVAGDGPYIESLKDLTQELGVEDKVTFEGYIDSEDIVEFLTTGSIGVIPHEPNEHWENTIPNKTFDYMCAGLPVVATRTPPLENLLSEIGCGKTFSASQQPVDVRNCILDIIDGESERFARNGQEAIREEYNWETECKHLVDFLYSIDG